MTSRTLTVLLGVGLVLAPARADDEAMKILDRAISAHGGSTALERMPTMVRSQSGTLVLNGMKLPFSSTLNCDLPDRYRLDVELGPQKTRVNIIVIRERGWEVNGGVALDMGKDRHQEALKEGYALYLTSLVPIRQSKNNFTLKKIPDIKGHGGKPAAGLLVSQKGQDDVRMYFDKESGLLVQMERRGSLAGLVTTKDYIFADFKEFRGVKLPAHHIERFNGQEYMESKNCTYTFPSRADERLFAKP